MKHATLDDYLRSPIGHWTRGEGWLHFCAPDPWLATVVFWGTLTASALGDVLRCATAAGRAIPDPHVALVDGRRVLSIDAACFAPASEYVVDHRARLRTSVAALAAVRPPGLFGAVAEGFFRMVPAPYPVAILGERGEALRWLGCEGHVAMLDEIEHAAAAADGRDMLEPVHRAIEVDLVNPSAPAVARALGVSVRTLQRRLRDAGTTFQREVTSVRIRAAQREMRRTPHTLARIASDVGFGSAAMFSVAFRKHVGLSPREWRDAKRAR